ncbi:hypothetical protein [Clostridium botulinum]|uniref:hypothetical protein n=1 Tax=Clostridium botulinum TaxID=1491 RepID=UPI0009476766|nr:hypothetical protein [Clostridium botulinum]APQ77165.1 hypothetical protein RSJ10_2426 [Clostridium botulinum]MBN3354035.1 hypothetical protein [Clostridium botulinum]QDY29435.1 hypothetical protein CGQ41_11735 [Clostridium botulinum]
MSKKLSEIIKELEDKGAIKKYYLHRQYYTGEIELNIEFENNIADEVLNENKIEEIDTCAFWE